VGQVGLPPEQYRRRVSCEKKACLAMEYEAATSAFSEAVKELHRKIGTSPKEEYQRLERISTEARVKSER
jgi:hypothetical protein